MARRGTYGSVDETGWQDTVVDYALLKKWRVAHFGVAMTPGGKWLTPGKYNARGFPDLVLLRERVIFVELKTKEGRLRPDQVVWLDGLRAAGQEVYVWRPSDWEEVQTVLMAPPRTDMLNPSTH